MNELIRIFKVDLKEAQRIASQPTAPHSHDFEELLIGNKGHLDHFIDFESTVIEAPFVSFVTQGKIHRLVPGPSQGECDIWAIRFKSELIADTTFQLYSSFHGNANISMPTAGCFNRINALCQIMYEEYLQEASDLAVMRQLLATLFSFIESDRRKLHLNDNESKKIRSNTFRSFLKLLDAHFREVHDVSFYAEKLFMGSRNLNNVCQHVLRQSVFEIIENRRLTEAKNLLITTDLTVAEIGYELGFKEKTYFTHIFRKKVGITPTDFKKEMNKLIT